MIPTDTDGGPMVWGEPVRLILTTSRNGTAHPIHLQAINHQGTSLKPCVYIGIVLAIPVFFMIQPFLLKPSPKK